MAMAEAQGLDYNAPLISIRRSSGAGVEGGRRWDRQLSRNNSGEIGLRSPGGVPFLWEQTPGVSKTKQAEEICTIGSLRPPPSPLGRKSLAADTDAVSVAVHEAGGRAGAVEEVREEVVAAVEVVKAGRARVRRKEVTAVGDVASSRAFEERVTSRPFFGEIALNAIREPPERRGRLSGVASVKVGGESPKLRQWEEFADAAETFSPTTGEKAVNREFIMQRFLPAAKELSGEQQRRRSSADDGERVHAQRAGASRFAAVRKGEMEAEEEEEDEVEEEETEQGWSFVSRMGCGLLPRVGKSVGHSSPCFPFMARRRRNRTPSPSRMEQFEEACSEFWEEDTEEEGEKLGKSPMIALPRRLPDKILREEWLGSWDSFVEAGLKTGAQNRCILSPHHDGRGFLGLPHNRISSESDLVPIRKDFMPEASRRQKLEDLLRIERIDKPAARRSVSSLMQAKVEEIEGSEAAQSNRSSRDSCIFDSEGNLVSSYSEGSSGRSVSTDQDDISISLAKGWPLGALQPFNKEPQVQRMLPPLPPSPAESWLWASLSARIPQFLLPKSEEEDSDAKTKWQLLVTSEHNTTADRLRYSGELRHAHLLAPSSLT